LFDSTRENHENWCSTNKYEFTVLEFDITRLILYLKRVIN